MGCANIKNKPTTPHKKMIMINDVEQDLKNLNYSLYTVKEELSEMEQSLVPSKRQSMISPFPVQKKNEASEINK